MIVDKGSVAVAVIAKDCNEKLIQFISDEFCDFDVILVTPNCKNDMGNVKVYSDDFFLSYNDVEAKLKGTNLRVGWYYQQFLKYTVCLKLPYQYIYIVDGDSVVSRDSFELSAVTTTGKKAEEEYLKFNRKIVDIQNANEVSYVTNEMLFKKDVLNSLLNNIESKFRQPWLDAIIECLKKNDDVQFSEYQLYGSFAVNIYSWPVKRLKVFRRMDCISKSIQVGLSKYDLLAFEGHHKTGLLRLIRAKILFIMGRELG